MSIGDCLEEHGITELLHFTTNIGLLGTLSDGKCLSRALLPKESYLQEVYPPNAKIRYDVTWVDHVNLSISRTNDKFFKTSRGWHEHEDVWWCVLSFDPVIATHAGVHFATTNNRYSGCRRAPEVAGFKALFAPKIKQWEGQIIPREDDLPLAFPTCRQAEVLYPQFVPTEHLQRIYVVNDLHHDIAEVQTGIVQHRPVPIEIRPDVFE